jgi:phosphoribosylcarboxyaminoimidazole (NCAIR) mutase
VAVLALSDSALAGKLADFRKKQADAVLKSEPLKL